MHDYKFSQANAYYHRGQSKQAIDLLKELLAEEPNVAEYHGLLAACLLANKRLYAAEYELAIALKLDPQIAFFYVLSGKIALLNNQTKQAIEFCDEALRIEPQLLDAILLKSDVYSMYGERQQSKHWIDFAANLHPDSVTVAHYYCNYYFTGNNTEKAEQYAREALSIDPQNEPANILMGKIKLSQGELGEAEYHAKLVIRDNPHSTAALKLFCDIKMRKNFFLGLWWRFNAKMTSLSNLQSSLVLIAGYLIFMLTAQILQDFEYQLLSRVTSYAWLALVLYSWVGIPMYYKRLKKELAQFSFNPQF